MKYKDNALNPPTVSIGMPVYNGEKYIATALDSLLEQTFEDFEIIISDNASTDDTSKICQEYAAGDERIHYIRQTENIGMLNNFLAVLNEARAEYFKWYACDDAISNDYIEINYAFLKDNPEYVASTSPNGFEGKPLSEQTLVDFSLDGNVFERFLLFFDNCWYSHGIFYALIRRDTLKRCEILRSGFFLFAQDWSIDLYLASKGKINRTSEGIMTFGVNGISRGVNAYTIFRISNVELIFPFYYFSKYVIKLISKFSLRQKGEIYWALIKLNVRANRNRMGRWRKQITKKIFGFPERIIVDILKRLENRSFKRLCKRLFEIEKSQLKATLMQAQLIAEAHHQKNKIHSLAEIEFSCFSQWGEDGIIDWLIEMLPEIPNTFIEFGVQDYRESNTRFLLHLRNWKGLVMDGSEEFCSDIKRQEISWRYNVTASHTFIDCENINQLITSSGMSGDIGLLSVDIDGNDYWVWEAIDTVSPAIVICEYNAVFGDRHQISVPYRSDFQRSKAHFSNLYFGASLPALVALAEQKGYVFVGTNSNGCNAFFVRNDLKSKVVDSISEIKSFPSSFRESRNSERRLTYVSGSERIGVINHLPVFDFKTQSTCLIGDLDQLYSTMWLK